MKRPLSTVQVRPDWLTKYCRPAAGLTFSGSTHATTPNSPVGPGWSAIKQSKMSVFGGLWSTRTTYPIPSLQAISVRMAAPADGVFRLASLASTSVHGMWLAAIRVGADRIPAAWAPGGSAGGPAAAGAWASAAPATVTAATNVAAAPSSLENRRMVAPGFSRSAELKRVWVRPVKPPAFADRWPRIGPGIWSST